MVRRWLSEDEVFPFWELRAAAQDLRRRHAAFDEENARRRIVAQLETLRRASQRHVVLSAFGCGAFRNPAKSIARIYAEEISLRLGEFDVVAFAIHYPGYGEDNFPAFVEALSGVNLRPSAEAVSGALLDKTLHAHMADRVRYIKP